MHCSQVEGWLRLQRATLVKTTFHLTPYPSSLRRVNPCIPRGWFLLHVRPPSLICVVKIVAGLPAGMLQKHVPPTPGSSPTHPMSSAGIQIRPIPGTLRSAGSDNTPSQDIRVRKTRSLRETIAKTVGAFLEAQKARQKEEDERHLSEPVLRPLITATTLQRQKVPYPSLPDEPRDEDKTYRTDDNLSQLIKNAVTCPIHKSSLLSLRGEAAADTLSLMQEVRPVCYKYAEPFVM